MPDIIEQLEEGKKLQEENGIDVESLRTKVSSDEEDSIEKPKKRSRKKKLDSKEEKETKEQSSEDPFAQAEKILNESETKEDKKSDESNDKQQENTKPEKYPGFDFNNYYKKGQKIYYVRVCERLGIKELMELKIRTIYPKMIVACEDKKATQCIGPDTQDMIYTDRYSAVEAYNNIKITAYKDTSVKNELGDTEIEDTED